MADPFTRRAAFAAFRNTPYLTRVFLIGSPAVLSIVLLVLGIAWEHREAILAAWDHLDSVEDVYALVNVTGAAAAEQAEVVLDAARRLDVSYVLQASKVAMREEAVTVGGKIWNTVVRILWGRVSGARHRDAGAQADAYGSILASTHRAWFCAVPMSIWPLPVVPIRPNSRARCYDAHRLL